MVDGVGRFVTELAADPPGPAAGSAAAVTAAMAAALLELAARKSLDAHAAASAAGMRERALSLAEADARAYAEVLDSSGKRRIAALERANGVLREIGTLAGEVGELAEPLARTARGALRGDALAAGELAAAVERAVERLLEVNRDERR